MGGIFDHDIIVLVTSWEGEVSWYEVKVVESEVTNDRPAASLEIEYEKFK